MVAKSELFCQSEAASRIGEIRELFMRQERRTLLHATGATGYFLAFTSSLGLPLGIAQLHGSLLHDVAKSYPPFYRLARLRREFTREDEQVMALHPEFGYRVIEKKRLGRLVDQKIVRYHHRLFHKDGEAIPLTVRAFSVCDGYDALREDRPYRKGYSHEEALNYFVWTLVTAMTRVWSGNLRPMSKGSIIRSFVRQMPRAESSSECTISRVY